MFLEIPADLVLPKGTEELLGKLTLDISRDDGMYDGNSRHYLSCGASALNVILATLRLANVRDPIALLDFGAGAGRVTRWLRAAFPAAAIDACDLREQDCVFCRDRFNARTWTSGTEIASLHAPGTYDLIWLGSVITHLSSANAIALIDTILSWANPGGLIIASFHGRLALRRQNSGEFRYIHDMGWSEIKDSYEKVGYGYSDYAGQTGYGVSVTKPSWISGLLEHRAHARLVVLTESAWDNHHDVVGIQAV